MIETLEFLESRKSPRSSRGSRIEIEHRPSYRPGFYVLNPQRLNRAPEF
jgi:hypothetical protein